MPFLVGIKLEFVPLFTVVKVTGVSLDSFMYYANDVNHRVCVRACARAYICVCVHVCMYICE